MLSLQFLLHFEQHLGSMIAQHGTAIYVILFAIVCAEIGVVPLFFLPGDPLLFLCGAYCATGAIDVLIVAPVIFAAAVAGSVLNYAAGAAVGNRVFTREYRWLDRSTLLKTHTFYETHGGMTFVLSPFIAVVRTFAPFVAGVARMTFARFASAVVTGAAIWVVTLVGGGYYFGNIPIVRDHMTAITLLGMTLGVGSLAASGVWRYVSGR